VYVIHPVTCDNTTNATTGLMRGIGRIGYVRADYDSLLTQFWRPVTNDYQMTMITNSKAITLSFRRIVTQPDFLFTAADITTGALLYDRTTPGFNNQANVLSALAGPGIIETPTTVSFNKVGPLYFNATLDTMDGTSYFTQTPGGGITNSFYSDYYLWANYDGTTNTPVVFPNGTSIENLQNQLLVKVSPTTLPLGTAGVVYPGTTFTATGGSFTQPFTWTSSELPAGMTLSADGTLGGTPTQPGTYDFTLTLTDAVSRSVDWNYSIIIQ
jgi:hypothetical protein